MSQQGPVLIVSTTPRPSFAAVLDETKLFPVVVTDWNEVGRAIEQVKPAAIIAAAEGIDFVTLSALAKRAAARRYSVRAAGTPPRSQSVRSCDFTAPPAASATATPETAPSMPVLSRNAVLKGEFRVGARLGEGACAEVYCCERVQGAKLSRAQKLQQSDADLVVKAAPIPPQSKKKAKDYMDKKRAADTLFAEHLLYANVLNRHPRRFGTKVGYGEDQNCRYLVLERLGPSLGDEMAETRLTPQQLASIGADCLASLEVLHAQKYVYCDMKPENIMLGTCSSGRIRDKDQARLVDFGVATRYVSAVSGKHKAEDEGGGQAGTPRFASLASSSSPPARRDDVEALAYVLLCAAADDRLPWDSAQSDEAVLAAKKRCGDAYGVLARLAAPFPF